MKLNIKNLGAISNVEIDLSKNINIFCGQNSTGKTYLAYIIYALINHSFKLESNSKLANDLVHNLYAEYELQDSLLIKYRNQLIDNLKVSLHQVFGISEETSEKLFKDFEISYCDSEEVFFKKLSEKEISFTRTFNKSKFRFIKSENSRIVNIILDSNSFVEKSTFEYLESYLVSIIYSMIIKDPIPRIHILPVERNSIFTFKNQLSNTKHDTYDYLKKMSSSRKKDKFEAFLETAVGNYRYPMAITDGIDDAENLTDLKKIKGEFYDEACEIEKKILKGSINIDSDDEINFKCGKVNLPIQTSSSIIKSLSSLIIYLKHIAKKGDLIIIDEPEVNLHPDIQVEIIRILISLSNKGFKFIISTHSDYIIRELNNMIMFSSLKKKKLTLSKEYYSDDLFIDINTLNVLYFDFVKKSSKSVKVSNVKVDDFGFEILSIDKTINQQNEIAENLYYKLLNE